MDAGLNSNLCLHYNYLPFFLFFAHLAKTISPIFINSILQRLLKQRLSPAFDCACYISLSQRVVLKLDQFPSSLRLKTKRTFWSIKPLKAIFLTSQLSVKFQFWRFNVCLMSGPVSLTTAFSLVGCCLAEPQQKQLFLQGSWLCGFLTCYVNFHIILSSGLDRFNQTANHCQSKLAPDQFMIPGA